MIYSDEEMEIIRHYHNEIGIEEANQLLADIIDCHRFCRYMRVLATMEKQDDINT